MRDENIARRDVEREIKAQIGMSVALWVAERARLTAKSGDGFRRYDGKPGAHAMRTSAKRCISAGVEWVDLERAIRRVAADPRGTPYQVLDAALSAQAERETETRMRREECERRDREADWGQVMTVHLRKMPR